MNSTFNESDPNATRLLIIDDDAKLAGLLRDYLEPLGYVIDLVHNGKDGLQLALQLADLNSIAPVLRLPKRHV